MRLICESWKMQKFGGATYIDFSTLCTVYVCAFHTCVYISGLVFDESQGPDATLIPEKQKPKVALSQDPKQAKVQYMANHTHV